MRDAILLGRAPSIQAHRFGNEHTHPQSALTTPDRRASRRPFLSTGCLIDGDSDIAYIYCMNKKAIMARESIQRKEYIYSIGGVQLKFTLRTDVKSEMKTWLELMARAKTDVEEDLKALDK